MNYIVGDFVIQLKNASMAHKREITVPYSNISKAIAQVLKKEGFVDSIKEEVVKERRVLTVALRYQRRKPVITNVKLVSKPSLRTYVGSGDIAKQQGRAMVAVISTNTGVLTGREAIEKGVGGELLFKIW